MGDEERKGTFDLPADKLKRGEFLSKIDDTLEAFVTSEFSRRRPGAKRVLVASLTLTNVAQEAYGTHCSNFYQLGRDCPDYDFTFVTPRRVAIDNMRNLCVKLAISGDFDYLYFFDDDTVNDRNVLGRLLERMEEFNACSAGYYLRGYPFNPMAFQWTEVEHEGQTHKIFKLYDPEEYVDFIDEDKVLRRDCAAVGCGCTLFRTEDFKKVPFPWFKTGLNHTEDAWWFAHAHQYIEGYKVGMDFNITCGHLCSPIFVDAHNQEVMREFHAKLKEVGGLSQ